MIKRIAKLIPILIFGIAVAVNLVFIALIFANRLEQRRAESQYGLPRGNRYSAPLIGVEPDGSPVNLSDNRMGTAIWYASKDCPYCKRDEEWKRLSKELQAKGMRVVVLLPSREYLFNDEDWAPKNVQQIAFVNPEWVAQYPMHVTPTLLIVDGNQRLLWHRRGMLSREDVASALDASKAAAR